MESQALLEAKVKEIIEYQLGGRSGLKVKALWELIELSMEVAKDAVIDDLLKLPFSPKAQLMIEDYAEENQKIGGS